MKKITQENLFEKNQHLSILEMLWRYPDGLFLYELTYLLTRMKNMNKMSYLKGRFISERKNIFKTRQRINDCLRDLRRINFILKDGKKYKINWPEVKLFNDYINITREAKRLLKESKEEYEEIVEVLKYANEEEQKDFDNNMKEYAKKNPPPWM
jgi:hypothetical protein